jgi:hypothetical protein
VGSRSTKDAAEIKETDKKYSSDFRAYKLQIKKPQ